MASSADVSVVKAGYWICWPDYYFIRPVDLIPSQLFTHLYAGFAEVNADTGDVILPHDYSYQFQTFTDTVRGRSPDVKTLLSIGGEGSDIAPVVADPVRRARFIKDSIYIARDNGFDGLDLCWLYPSDADQMTNLGVLLSEWRVAVDAEARKTQRPTLLLTAAVFHHRVISGPEGERFSYPCQAINEHLDWINVLAIDFYTPSSSPQETKPVHAWLNPTDPYLCGREGIIDWIGDEPGVKKEKLVLALPFYGYEWILNPNIPNPGFFAPAIRANEIRISYRDIQEKLRMGIYKTVNDRQYIAAYSYNNEGRIGRWIGYDDGCSIFGKVSDAMNLHLRGYVAWHVGADDDNWSLSRAGFESWPQPA